MKRFDAVHFKRFKTRNPGCDSNRDSKANIHLLRVIVLNQMTINDN
jgi:hypothetical protein